VALKDKVLDWSTVDLRCYRYATLINRKSTKVQALGFRHANPGLLEAIQRVGDECQVACRDKHTCIDKSEKHVLNIVSSAQTNKRKNEASIKINMTKLVRQAQITDP